MTERSGAMTRTALIAFVFAVVATCWCAWCTGAGLALFFGAIFLTALYVPPLTLAWKPEVRWIGAIAISAGVIACWGISIGWAQISVAEWLKCAVVCSAFVFALCGLASALSRLGIAGPPAAGAVVCIALLWLTWPVWLSHGLTQSRVNALVAAHPLLAINGVLLHLGSWDRAPIAYQRLTILNQDISYHPPRSILLAVFVHGLIGVGGLLLTHWRMRAAPAQLVDAEDLPT
jgi:hypothetical protein